MRVSPAIALSTMASTRKTVDVSITSDVMCPWCWVGLRKLQEASKQTNIHANITWKPFLLRPNIPDEGMPKGGTPSSRVGPHLRRAGESVGIDFTGLTDRTPNTRLFHAVMKMLQDKNKVDSATVTAFQEQVFLEYFTLGVYPDEKGLLMAAKEVKDSVVYDSVASLFQDTKQLNSLKHQVVVEAEEASRRGISGVPSFSFGGEKYPAFSGAQPTETFVRYLHKYAQDD